MKYKFKIIIGFFVLLYTIVTLLFFNFYKELAIKDTKQEAISILYTINSIRSYIDKVQRPVLYELMATNEAKDLFDPRVHSSSFITQYIYDKQFEDKHIKYRYKLVSTNPTNPIHKANKFETEILEQFKNGDKKEYFSIINEGSETYFYIAIPTSKNKASCLKCHGNPSLAPKRMVEMYGKSSGYNERVGDLRAMISLKIPVVSILSYHLPEFITGGIAMFLVFVIFIVLIYAIYKKDMNISEKKDKLFTHQNRLAVMGGMIGNISHQWKQPLTQLSYVLMNIELKYENDKLTKKILNKKVREANEQISYMSQTVNDFKDFFSPFKKTDDYSIEDIIHKSKRLLQASLEKNKIDVKIDIKNRFLFTGCENEIVQVLLNIINNAKDSFISNNIENRVINIITYVKSKKKIIEIINNAGNIDEKVKTKIFEPYFSTKDLSLSSGIGLYICKVIIENYNGVIDVENIDDKVIFKIIFDEK